MIAAPGASFVRAIVLGASGGMMSVLLYLVGPWWAVGSIPGFGAAIVVAARVMGRRRLGYLAVLGTLVAAMSSPLALLTYWLGTQDDFYTLLALFFVCIGVPLLMLNVLAEFSILILLICRRAMK